MNVGAFICLGLIGFQLCAQIGIALHACFGKARPPDSSCCPPVSTTARRDFLDRKAEIERDARHRF
jgi:hypothetical protein